MTTRKKTLRERILAAKAKRDAVVEAADNAALDFIYGDTEKTITAHQCGLCFQERLQLMKSTQLWPRIVLELYEAEREIAAADEGRQGEPSDLAYEKVAKAIGLGEDRIKALCAEGRRDVASGAPRQPKMSAGEFITYWRELP